MSVFNHYAQYYDLLYRDKNYPEEAAYVDKLIQTHAPKAKTLLELGCGTGLHAIALAELGYRIDGIDISQDMLNQAAIRFMNLPKKLVEKIALQQGDVRTFRNQQTYDAVVALFHILSYQTTNADLRAMIETAAIHAKDAGLFIFDVWYGPAVLTERPELRVRELENSDIKIIRIARPVHYPNQNRVDVNYQILIFDKKTTKMEELLETHPMRYLFRPELEILLAERGYALLKTEEWLTGKATGVDSWGVTCVAQKLRRPERIRFLAANDLL